MLYLGNCSAVCNRSQLNVPDPDSKVHGANIGPIWGRQDPGGPHVDPMNFGIWGVNIKTDLQSNRIVKDNMVMGPSYLLMEISTVVRLIMIFWKAGL